MARLALFLFLLATPALAVAAVATMIRAIASPPVASPRPGSETSMPRAARTTAYVLLLILLLGVASGWMGPS